MTYLCFVQYSGSYHRPSETTRPSHPLTQRPALMPHTDCYSGRDESKTCTTPEDCQKSAGFHLPAPACPEGYIFCLSMGGCVMGGCPDASDGAHCGPNKVSCVLFACRYVTNNNTLPLANSRYNTRSKTLNQTPFLFNYIVMCSLG